MVFPLTNLVILFVLVVGTAANIQELLKNCTENADCGKNANCRDFYQGCAQKGCACDEGFAASSNNTDCIKVVKEGEACPDGGTECPEGTKCNTGVNPKCFPLIPIGENCPQANRSRPKNTVCKGGKTLCKSGYMAKGNNCIFRLHDEDCSDSYPCYANYNLQCINAKCRCESGFRWMDFSKWMDGGFGACFKIPGDNCTIDSDCNFRYFGTNNAMVCSNTVMCICDPVNYPTYVPELQMCMKNGSLIFNDIGQYCSHFNPKQKLQSCNVNNDLMCKMCPEEGNYQCVSELKNKTSLSTCSDATRKYVTVVIMTILLTLKVL